MKTEERFTQNPSESLGFSETPSRAPRRHEPSFTLATDLDGTLLGGTDEDRARLNEALVDARTIFVTGRGLETIRPLLYDPLVPKPQFVIADVGATIVDVQDMRPVQPLQSEIDARWPGTLRVLEALERFEGLVRQEVPQERRCSFYYEDDDVVTDELRGVVQDLLGCELLVSAGRYLDILPRGVSKGSTLLRLLEHLGIPRSSVIVAGDTLNDLSLFLTGLRGVVVHNAERALVERVGNRPHLHLAQGVGAAGILEALLEHDLVAKPVSTLHDKVEPPERPQLLMVYHRLPFEEYRRGKKTYRRRHKSPNGIIPSLLGFFADGRAGSWIGWSMQDSREVEGFEENVPVSEDYENLTASRIPLTKEDVNRFYKRFSKEAFWPVIFSFPGKAVFDQAEWEHFVEINKIFAERTAREAEPSAMVWIHDYNLWMVPGLLRELRPDVKIGFFHHTAFPPSDVFNMLPWRQQIVGSLIQCDYVGFHIPRYVENFVDVVCSNVPARVTDRVPCAPRFVTYGCALGVDSVATALDVGGRHVRVGAHPVGIDVERIKELVSDPGIGQRIKEIRTELGDRSAILSIERLDYVKGPLQKLEAFERLLEQHEELHGKVVLVNVVTPPAPGMQIYKQIGEKLDQATGRVNGRFGRIDWTPVRYFLRSMPFEEVIAHYAACDVAWITPLRDGLNLVAKEYVAAKAASGTDGVLVMSEFAGAAVELHGALLANPYDSTSMINSLHHALVMSPDERRQRQRRLSQIVEFNDVRTWGNEFLAAFATRKVDNAEGVAAAK